MRRGLAQIACRGALAGALAALLLGGSARLAVAQEAAEPPHPGWSFEGPFGTFDRAAAQRGFQVYQEVCAACHSLKLAYYRNLEGIGLTPAQVAAIAASVQVPTLNDSGEPTTRPGMPSDHFRSPFPNDLAARAANNGALPPDQSVLVNAREGGADYIYGVLTGYSDPPPTMKMGDGMNYNKDFPGNQIAMPQPLHDDQVTYADGTKATVAQEAHDVTTFLYYVANPHMEQRKQMGWRIILFLIGLTGVTYAAKRKIWAGVH